LRKRVEKDVGAELLCKAREKNFQSTWITVDKIDEVWNEAPIDQVESQQGHVLGKNRIPETSAEMSGK